MGRKKPSVGTSIWTLNPRPLLATWKNPKNLCLQSLQAYQQAEKNATAFVTKQQQYQLLDADDEDDEEDVGVAAAAAAAEQRKESRRKHHRRKREDEVDEDEV